MLAIVQRKIDHVEKAVHLPRPAGNISRVSSHSSPAGGAAEKMPTPNVHRIPSRELNRLAFEEHD